MVLKTFNGGKSWQEIEYPNLKGLLFDILFDPLGNTYASLDYYEYPDTNVPVIMKSKDYGMSWDTLFLSPELDPGNSRIPLALMNDILFVGGRDGKIIKLDTSGNLIEVIETGQSRIYGSQLNSNQNIVIRGRGEIIQSVDGGNSWQTVFTGHAKIIDFQKEAGWLMLANKNYCPTDVYQANDVMAFSEDGGKSWSESETTTNMGINYQDHFKRANGDYLLVINNEVLELSRK